MINSALELILPRFVLVLKPTQPTTKGSLSIANGLVKGFLLTVAFGLLAANAHGGSRSRAAGVRHTLAGTTINLRDYGAVGDGVTDDGPALQSALEALADAGGGDLFVPDGHYAIVTPVAVDFAARASSITIYGTPSSSPPGPTGDLGRGLNLTAEFVIKAGAAQTALLLENLDTLLVQDLVFIGDPTVADDAKIVLSINSVEDATIRRCEFYGLAGFSGGGAIVYAAGGKLQIADSAFLGCAANSGLTTSIVQIYYWKGIVVSGTRFVDYGNRPGYYSKTTYMSPFSWLCVGGAAPLSNLSPRRDVIIKDVFLDEGAYFALTVMPEVFAVPAGGAISLLYVSNLFVNVTNLGAVGLLVHSVDNVVIENSHFGWSHNATGAMELTFVKNALLNEIECVLSADRISAADSVGELSVINSVYNTLDSQAGVTRVITTDDLASGPGRYVNQKYLDILGHAPDIPGYVYWSQQRARCNDDAQCTTDEDLSNYLNGNPAATFAITGRLLDANGDPITAATVSLSGAHGVDTLTDGDGKYTFSGLATSGEYTVTPAKTFYGFKTIGEPVAASRSFTTPNGNQNVDFSGSLATYSIQGRVNDANTTAMGGVTMTLSGGPAGLEIPSQDTNNSGDYSFVDLPAGYSYSITAAKTFHTFEPALQTVVLGGQTVNVNFVGTGGTFSLSGNVSDGTTGLANATVTLSGAIQLSTATDAGGNYSFAEVPAGGNYVATVTKQHYTFSSQTLNNLSEDSIVDFAGQVIQYQITGNITLNSTSLSGIAVTLAGDQTAATVTNSSGGYGFTVNAGGNYTLSPSLTGYTFTPETIVFNGLSQNVYAAFAAHEVPTLLTSGDTNRAVAFNSLTMVTEPFKLFTTPLDFGPDRRTRVSLFALHIPEDPTLITAQAEDDQGTVYPLSVDAVSSLPGVSEFRQINLRLNSQLPTGTEIKITISVDGIASTPVILKLD